LRIAVEKLNAAVEIDYGRLKMADIAPVLDHADIFDMQKSCKSGLWRCRRGKEFQRNEQGRKARTALDNIEKMSDQELKQLEREVREFRGKAAEDNEGERQP